MTVRSWPVVGLTYGVIWLFVRGSDLAPDALAGQLLLGVAVGLPVAFVFRRLYVDRVDPARWVGVLPAVARYFATFTSELVRANVDVAYRVLSPGMPIKPEVILIPLRVETAAAVTVIANSITITPGTLTLDHDDEANALYVHVIDGSHPDEIVEPIRRWEDYALEIFDEEASPDEPAPGIIVSGGEVWSGGDDDGD
ncbi:Na+/H+ antiporter subunit E [Salinilacihabitans rarus]|uniref:Na+/H+ antiporter subunit E n=1 Tax=Salinilacihabitans rarus TaxID=2961596 RepID=UPI0020C8D450|nr:Na+/H+ antiporter subunit E [Salinilacihabitans rarus]